MSSICGRCKGVVRRTPFGWEGDGKARYLCSDRPGGLFDWHRPS